MVNDRLPVLFIEKIKEQIEIWQLYVLIERNLNSATWIKTTENDRFLLIKIHHEK